MNRIDKPFTPENSGITHKSFKSKSTNMEKFLTREDLDSMSSYEFKIIFLFLIEKRQKIKDSDAEENQLLRLSDYKESFKNKKVYYAAIQSLIDKDIITKIEGKQSLYRVNPKFINNLTYQQSIDAGIKQDYRKIVK